MKTPICETCLKSDFLCAGCEAKLASGELSEADLQIARHLYELRKETGADVSFDKSIEVNNVIVIQ
ncbi:transcription elongation factor NusA, partial [archaeon]|nr:transcription elongation factor NusA [archaeon]